MRMPRRTRILKLLPVTKRLMRTPIKPMGNVIRTSRGRLHDSKMAQRVSRVRKAASRMATTKESLDKP
jgi:hypothetical protein